MAKKDDKEKELQTAINEVKELFIKSPIKVDYQKIFADIENLLNQTTSKPEK